MLYCYSEYEYPNYPSIIINRNGMYYHIWIETFMFGEFIGKKDFRDMIHYKNKYIYSKL